MRILSYFICLLFIPFSSHAEAPKVLEKSGNIYLIQANNQTIQLTSSGQAHDPVLSPDQKSIAFIKTSTDPMPKECRDFDEASSTYANQIWIIDIEHKKEQLLVKNNFACDKPTEMIIAPHHLTFSPDSKTLYFLTHAWTTSNALHAVNIADASLRYLLPANSLAVVADGEYKGDLILNQHRYFIGGGSYDWYWLFTPEGKEIGPLGEKSEI